MAERKSQLDALAFDVQFFISEHAQDLSPQQNRQMLRLLNELQRSFQEILEQTAAQVDALQGHLQQMEQEALVKLDPAETTKYLSPATGGSLQLGRTGRKSTGRPPRQNHPAGSLCFAEEPK
ncbi:hypothetical protein H8959_005836 [Pygathrix nigripes]